MRVWLDETECDLDANSIAEAIERAAEIAEQSGRLIVDVQVDGISWSEEQIQQAQQQPTHAEEVRMTSSDPVALVRHTWGDAADALREADAHQREAAALIQSDQTSEAMDRLQEALQIWSSVQQALSLGSEALQIDLNSESIDGTPVMRYIEALNDQLKVLRTALQEGDPVGLSDTLLYDLPQTVTDWRSLLDHLQARAAGSEGGG